MSQPSSVAMGCGDSPILPASHQAPSRASSKTVWSPQLRKSGENDQIFGSVTSSDIGEALTKKGFTLDRRQIQLHEPLKTVGEFTIPVKLHKDVTAHLKVVIEKEAVAE